MPRMLAVTLRIAALALLAALSLAGCAGTEVEAQSTAARQSYQDWPTGPYRVVENGISCMSCHGRACRRLMVTPPIPPRTISLGPYPNIPMIAA